MIINELFKTEMYFMTEVFSVSCAIVIGVALVRTDIQDFELFKD